MYRYSINVFSRVLILLIVTTFFVWYYIEEQLLKFHLMQLIYGATFYVKMKCIERIMTFTNLLQGYYFQECLSL